MKLGNDIIEIDRIRQAIEKSSSFKVRVYTIHEIEYCKSRNKGCYESFAGIYAAKEAFIKALGIGMGRTLNSFTRYFQRYLRNIRLY